MSPFLGLMLLVLVASGCGGDSAEGGQRGRGGAAWGGGNGGAPAAVPVEVAPVERRAIAAFVETNGVLEAETEVDVVARLSAPIVELLAEEGMTVRRGQVLARLEAEETRAQLEINRVALEEARLAFERAKALQQENLISGEEYERAQSTFETASAQLEASRIQLGYTDVRAPFDGLIVTRYVDFAQQVAPGTPMFRISDFDPLLCPIQVPERELPKLRLRQKAYLTVEAWGAERFPARVLRISPVVDAATGTIKVTLEVEHRRKLRPGMFARVFIQTAVRPDALVIPKSALSLESIGDTVYVAAGDTAARREVTLGFTEGDFVEVTSGVAENEAVVVIGQDGLSDGTPIQVLGGRAGAPEALRTAEAEARGGDRSGEGPAAGPGGPGPGGWGGRRGGRRPDLSQMTPEQLERAKEFMRARGMTEEQIEERIRRRKQAAEDPPADPQ